MIQHVEDHDLPTRVLTRSWAGAIVAGTLPPYEGARLLWRAWSELLRPDDLTVFVGLASEWEDDPAHRDEYEQDILEAARNYLGL